MIKSVNFQTFSDFLKSIPILEEVMRQERQMDLSSQNTTGFLLSFVLFTTYLCSLWVSRILGLSHTIYGCKRNSKEDTDSQKYPKRNNDRI
jgi:hypothetical protein